MKSSSRQRRIRPLKVKAATADSAAEFDNYGAEPNMKLSHAFMVVLALHVVAVGGLFAFNKVKAGHSKVSEKLQTEVAAGQASVTSEEAKPLVPVPVHKMAQEVKKEVAKVAEVSAAPSKPQEQVIPIAPKKMLPQSGQHPREGVDPSSVAPTTSALTATKNAFLATKTTATSTAPTTVAPVASSSAVAALANMTSSTAVVAAPAPQSAAVEGVASTNYTIVKGDNPYKIAKRFHVSYDQLIKFNNISDPRKMQIGQKIRIPSKTPKAAGQG